MEPGEDGAEDSFKPIIGVVKDFHYASMQAEIGPMAMHFMPGNYEGIITIRMGNGNPAETLAMIEQTWNEIGTKPEYESFLKKWRPLIISSERTFWRPIDTSAKDISENTKLEKQE